jgi:hypothetical protein
MENGQIFKQVIFYRLSLEIRTISKKEKYLNINLLHLL